MDADVIDWQTVDKWVDRLGWAGLPEKPQRRSNGFLNLHVTQANKLPCNTCEKRIGCVTECDKFTRYVGRD